jgi:hypothetical protein
MKKNRLTIIEQFEDKISFFSNNVFFGLLIIGLIGLAIRIIFLHIDIPMNSDNLFYFMAAMDQSLGHTSKTIFASNDGWPSVLSLFFWIVQSNNFMDYMTLQKILTVGISVVTIIPIYFLGKQFVNKSYALLGSAIFIFDPRIIQNSLDGITDPLSIIAITISLALIFNKKYYSQYIAFATLSFSILVRSEAMFLIPIFFIIFFIRSGVNKKLLINLFIIIIIITSILLPMSIIRTEHLGHDGMTERISGGIIHINETGDGNESKIFSIIFNGIINMLKFLAWSQIPYLICFVPIGLILFIKNENRTKKLLIVAGISMVIPTIYAYSFASDSRYLFSLYPIFSILSIYSIKYFLQKTTKPKSITILIFSIIIISSIFYLNFKDVNESHEIEAYNLSVEIANRASIVNAFTPESYYLSVASLTQLEKFPVNSDKIKEKNIETLEINSINSLNELIEFTHKNEINYLIIDEKDRKPVFLKNIFHNEEKYPFLVKDFDSKDHGYVYHLKIFKIDYEQFFLLPNEIN